MSQQTAESFFDSPRAHDMQAWSGDEAVRILDDIRRAIPCSPRDARAAASRLVSLLSLPSSEKARGGLAPWQKRKIERFVREHLSRCLSVEELAGQVSLSASYFHHAFKGTFGTSPHAYITKLRIEAAQTMMRGGEEPLSQIAFACGFADQSHLCKIFRRVLGETPSAWRRNATASATRADPGGAPRPEAARESILHLGRRRPAEPAAVLSQA